MSKWDNIPNDILEQVVQHLGDGEPKTEWMYVNTQWFDMYQSIIYKDITIHLDFFGEVLNNIINSKFQPGRWVKSINFSALVVPSNFDSLNYDEDPLNLLMSYCFQVKKIVLPSAEMRVEDWSYFLTALMNNSNWNLNYLVIDDNCELEHGVKEYYNCAYHSRNYLREMILKDGMIISENYKCLQNFKQLTTLEIGENVLEDFYDCCNLLKNLPHLSEVKVSFSLQQSPEEEYYIYKSWLLMEEYANDYGHEKEYIATTYTNHNLRRMTLINYSPSRDDDDITMMLKKFAKLEYLNISFSTETQLCPSLMKSLFTFMHASVPEYCILYDSANEVEFMTAYYDSMKDMQDNDRDFHMTVTFDEKEQGGDDEIKVGRYDNSSTVISFKAGVHWISELEEFQRPSRWWLFKLDNNVIRELDVDFGEVFADDIADSNDVGFYIDGLSAYKGLERLNIIGGTFETNSMLNQTQRPPQQQIITQLQFRYCNFNENFLPLISINFPYFERLEFYACYFQSFEIAWGVEINLPNTTVDTLVLSDEGDERAGRLVNDQDAVLLIQVVSEDQGASKCYVCVNGTGIMDEISRATFGALLGFERGSAIDVRVKSIKTFTFKVTRNANYDINITFP